MIRFLLIFFIFLLFDFYFFFSLKRHYSGRSKKVFYFIYGLTWFFFIVTLCMAFANFGTKRINTSQVFTVFMGTSFVFMITKLVISLFLILEDVYRFIYFAFQSLRKKEFSKNNIESRRKFVATVAYGVAAIPFLSLMYGIVYGRYDFRVHRIKLKSKRIPKSFNGLRIVQLSDIHIGSFGDQEGVAKGFKMVQDLNPDLILFTGDMVNNVAEEIEGFEDLLSGLSAKYGKYAVLGNHDYGEYIKWNSEEEKNKNIKNLIAKEESCGFRLLMNESKEIKIGEESIHLVGVENWGNKPFPQYGDLNKALADSVKEDFKILMSHDPDHFGEQVMHHENFVDLTLSGHTHGSQMGVEIPGFRWSPVQYRYDRWAGRYEEKGRVLYVNRGFGFIGYPGRVGIWPEITLIELEAIS